MIQIYWFRDEEIELFNASVQIYRYIWLLTTLLMDLVLVRISFKITATVSFQVVAVCKAFTYLIAVPVLWAFWTENELLYCICALPLRLVAIISAMATLTTNLIRTTHQRCVHVGARKRHSTVVSEVHSTEQRQESEDTTLSDVQLLSVTISSKSASSKKEDLSKTSQGELTQKRAESILEAGHDTVNTA